MNRTYFENKCVSLDRQLDVLVYDLYGLTEEEIKNRRSNLVGDDVRSL